MARGLEACGVKVEEGRRLLIVHGRGPGGVAGRRDGGDPARPPDRDGVPLPRACGEGADHGRRRRADRDELPGLRAADAGAGRGRRSTVPGRSNASHCVAIAPAKAVAVIMAIDGPAAAGKGTIAGGGGRSAAHLDTGLLYRAVGVQALDDGRGVIDPHWAAELARRLEPADLEQPALRSARAGQAASKVAALPEVRAALLDFQRRFAPPRGRGGARRARHRHGDLPGGGGEALRHRRGRGARGAASGGARAQGAALRGGARRSARPRRARRGARLRRWRRRRMRSCSTPPIRL